MSRSHHQSPESRSARKSRTRQSIVDETLALVGDRSFSSLSLREVAKAAGLVPTAFYRHFASMDDLGVTLVEDSMRVLRQMLRDGRRDAATRNTVPTVRSALAILASQVREHESQFQFLVREQRGGNAEVRRAIDIELQLFVKELTIDLSRNSPLIDWAAHDVELAAQLIVSVMLVAVADLLEAGTHDRRRDADIIADCERKLTMVMLGVSAWRPAARE